MKENVLAALLLTTAAGLATTIGSVLGLFVTKARSWFLAFALGFSAGVMMFVSFMELLPSGVKRIGFLPATAALLGGMAVMLLLDRAIPHDWVGEHDHSGSEEDGRLLRTGLLVALGIGIHNFPEGMATFTVSLENLHLGAAIAVAIALHNIPEGLAVSAPVYAATGSRRKAFLWSFLSGVSEPVGAAVAALVLWPFLTPALFGWLASGVAGIMAAISLDELIPTAKTYGFPHVPIIGVMVGMGVMALSIWMLAAHGLG